MTRALLNQKLPCLSNIFLSSLLIQVQTLQATQTDCSVLSFLKRTCDSPLDDETSSGGTQTEQAWESPVKDIDLIASDCLGDDIDLDTGVQECKTYLPNTRSEGQQLSIVVYLCTLSKKGKMQTSSR